MTNFLSLFSGIGGFDLAFERAGFECVGMCEIDPSARNILRRHFPNAPIYNDVRQIGRKTHAPHSIDVLCGGFPCQDVSVAGKRAGLDGERSGLWFEFARIIDELAPRVVELENVPGLLSSCGCPTCGAVRRIRRIHRYLRGKRQIHKQCAICSAGERMLASHQGRDFALILHWLAQRGYGVTGRVLDSQFFGVAQRRRRVFVIASLGSGSSAEVLFERESLPGDLAKKRKAGEGLASTIGASSPSRRNGGSNPTAGTFTIRQGNDGDKRGGRGYLGSEEQAMALSGQKQYVHQNDDLAPTLEAGDGEKWGSNQWVDKGAAIIQGAEPIGFAHRRTEFDGQEGLTPPVSAGNGGSGQPAVFEQRAVGALQSRDGKSISSTIDDKIILTNFQQNQRDEVRMTGGDGQVVGAQSADAGAKQQNYVAWDASHPDDPYRESGEISHTLQNRMGTGGNQVPLVGVRRLTPVECERLQGFPDGWTEWGVDENGKVIKQSDSTRYKQLGNAVSEPVGEWLANRIKNSLETT